MGGHKRGGERWGNVLTGTTSHNQGTVTSCYASLAANFAKIFLSHGGVLGEPRPHSIALVDFVLSL